LKNSLISTLMGEIEGVDPENPSNLSEIGITLDNDLHASVTDDSALSEWLGDKNEAVASLFNSENGVAVQLMDILEPFTESYGIINDRKDILNEQIKAYDARISRLEERMDKKEDYYRNQFITLQEALNTITTQQSMMTNLINSFSSFSL